MSYKEVGVKGECSALDFLKDNKYKILETNYSTKLGEIDIIAKINNVIVFIEVKTRQNDYFGEPQFAVNSFKQHKIRQVATQYLISKNLYDKVDVRFDVISILHGKINHIINAF